MSNLIQATELIKLLGNDNIRLVDTRFELTDPEAGYRQYGEAHISGAIHVDLDKDLSVQAKEHGGRHPLPDMNSFATMLGDRGISNSSHIIIYDDSAGLFSGRMWWMLKYAGHEKVQVLDGGFSSWLKAGFPVTTEAARFSKASFDLNLQVDMVADIDYVKRHLDNPDVILVDARAAERFRGEVEPLDKRAGHIPGAINLPYTDNLSGKTYKSKDELAQRLENLKHAGEIIMYCGSGVSANHNLIALEEVGIKGAKLYVGSWSDWSSYDENPVAVGEGT